MIEKHKFYVNRFTVGRYQVYLALEDAESQTSLTKVVDLTDDSITYRESESVCEADSRSIDDEYLTVAAKYLK